jgi:hypothetical protein
MPRLLCMLPFLLLPSCDDGAPPMPPHQSAERISCLTTADCVARGGSCTGGECRASNECATNADCAGGASCVNDANFGGLCTSTGQPAVPQPIWSCQSGRDCPVGMGCGSDGSCHADGECTIDFATGADSCSAGQLCYNPGNDSPRGFCSSERGSPDGYCRSDGHGACRIECNADGSCNPGLGATCVMGFCHGPTECSTSADCSPNHICEAYLDGSYGYGVCVDDPNPTCVVDPQGACRLRCQTDADCIDGGGCAPDGLCHASNECKTDPDCPNGEICYANSEFGGLCGAPR